MLSTVLPDSIDLAPAQHATGAADAFRADDLRHPTLRQRLTWWVLDRPRWLMLAARLLRWPLARFGNTVVVTGHDAVRAVLSDGASFPVPFGVRFWEMDREGENFILGMDDGQNYRDIHAEVVKALRLSDTGRIAELAGAEAEELVAEAEALIAAAAREHEMDAMGGLLIPVPLHLVETYYGVPVEHGEFHLWSMAMSAYAFAGPSAKEEDKKIAEAGGRRLGEAVDAAIAEALRGGGKPGTVLGRLVRASAGNPEVLTPGVLRATMVGLITGFVPTNVKASGQILKMLLRHPHMLEAAEAAARAGDDDLLRRCLFEVLRFGQTVPIMFRECAHERVLPSGQRVRPGMTVMAVSMLAAFDAGRVERPWRFDPARGEGDSLGFGFGQHRCVGVALAGAQITATFKPLLLRGGLREVAFWRRRPSYFASFMERKPVAFGERAAP